MLALMDLPQTRHTCPSHVCAHPLQVAPCPPWPSPLPCVSNQPSCPTPTWDVGCQKEASCNSNFWAPPCQPPHGVSDWRFPSKLPVGSVSDPCKHVKHSSSHAVRYSGGVHEGLNHVPTLMDCHHTWNTCSLHVLPHANQSGAFQTRPSPLFLGPK